MSSKKSAFFIVLMSLVFTLSGCFTSIPSSCQDCYHPTSKMLFPQLDPVSVRLDDNNILLIGGGIYDQNGKADLEKSFKVAQIYNIPEDRFYFAESMHFPRSLHHPYTATRLKDGRVLIVGGKDHYTGKLINAVEIFDPKNRRFQVVPSISIARTDHTATLLPNGKVLIAGGYTKGDQDKIGHYLSSALLFNPVSNTIQSTPSMAMPLVDHSSILLNDHRVLIVGGRESTARAACLPHAEYYDVRKNAFFELPNMNNDYCNPEVFALSDGKVLIMSNGESAIESFDRNKNRFSLFFKNPYFAAYPVLLGNNAIFFAMAGPLEKYPWDAEDFGYSALFLVKENKIVLIGPIPGRSTHYSAVFSSSNKVYLLGGVTSKPFGKAKLPVYQDTGYYINISDLNKLENKSQ